MKRVRRGVVAVAVAVALVAAAVGAFAQLTMVSASAAGQKSPVILVHGLFGSPSNWNQVIISLKQAGYTDDELHTFGYNSTSQSNVTTAEKLAAKVDQVLAKTGAFKVDIVGHSMGSLNSRYCIKYDGCAGKVDDWVSLAGPNNGTTNAGLCFWQVTCREMKVGSAFITKLNADSTLPGDVDGTVIWSRSDGVVTPASSSVLEGVDNIEVPGVSHLGMLTDDKVAELLVEALA